MGSEMCIRDSLRTVRQAVTTVQTLHGVLCTCRFNHRHARSYPPYGVWSGATGQTSAVVFRWPESPESQASPTIEQNLFAFTVYHLCMAMSTNQTVRPSPFPNHHRGHPAATLYTGTIASLFLLVMVGSIRPCTSSCKPLGLLATVYVLSG